jgi:hypothetical protein
MEGRRIKTQERKFCRAFSAGIPFGTGSWASRAQPRLKSITATRQLGLAPTGTANCPTANCQLPTANC